VIGGGRSSVKRDRELKCALLRIAQSRSDVRNETEWTERQCYLLMRTIDQIITEKLRERRWVKMIGPWREVKHAPNQEWAVKLVRLKQREQMIGQVGGHSRMNQEMAIRDGADAACDDLSPVEQRAVELVCGAKRKTRKNLIEERAIRLAECVLDDWFRTARPRGRPRGAGTLGSDSRDYQGCCAFDRGPVGVDNQNLTVQSRFRGAGRGRAHVPTLRHRHGCSRFRARKKVPVTILFSPIKNCSI
jgi:hypothetical protein